MEKGRKEMLKKVPTQKVAGIHQKGLAEGY